MDQSRGVPDGTDEYDPASSGTSTLGNTAINSSTTNSTATWKPNDEFLKKLTSMGFGSKLAIRSLYHTKNQSMESAIEWIFTNSEKEILPPEIENQLENLTIDDEEGATLIDKLIFPINDLCKMVFVVNSELSMGTGKIAAQVAHAALGLHRLLLQNESKHASLLLNWTEYGETKIVLKGESTTHLVELENMAISLDLPCYMVHDAGKTQVKAGSTTVLGIFGSNDQVDQITGTLSLY